MYDDMYDSDSAEEQPIQEIENMKKRKIEGPEISDGEDRFSTLIPFEVFYHICYFSPAYCIFNLELVCKLFAEWVQTLKKDNFLLKRVDFFVNQWLPEEYMERLHKVYRVGLSGDYLLSILNLETVGLNVTIDNTTKQKQFHNEFRCYLVERHILIIGQRPEEDLRDRYKYYAIEHPFFIEIPRSSMVDDDVDEDTDAKAVICGGIVAPNTKYYNRGYELEWETQNSPVITCKEAQLFNPSFHLGKSIIFMVIGNKSKDRVQGGIEDAIEKANIPNFLKLFYDHKKIRIMKKEEFRERRGVYIIPGGNYQTALDVTKELTSRGYTIINSKDIRDIYLIQSQFKGAGYVGDYYGSGGDSYDDHW